MGTIYSSYSSFFIKNEASDEKGTFDLESIQEFSNKARLCTCKIITDTQHGSGFFCRIPLGDKKELVNVLFTCHHVLTKEILLLSKNIKLEIDKKEKILPIKNRRIYSNPEMDYSCIEILDEDDIEDFYSIDDASLKKKFNPEEDYKGKLFIIFAIMKNNKTGLSNGVIKSIKKNEFLYTCNTYPGCSGGVIVKQNTNCVVGMHRGELKISKNTNIGILIRNIIDDINNNQININKKTEIKVETYENNIHFKLLDEQGNTQYLCYDSNILIKDMLIDILGKQNLEKNLDANKNIFMYKSKILNSPILLEKPISNIIVEGSLIKLFRKE